MKRRGFFKRLYQAAAIVALAPQIALRAPAPKLNLDDLHQAYAFRHTDTIDIYTDRWTATKIREAMSQYYKEKYEV